MMSALAAHPAPATRVLAALIPTVCDLYLSSGTAYVTRQSECLSILLDAVLASSALLLYLQKDGAKAVHPAKEYADRLLELASSAAMLTGSGEGSARQQGAGLQLLCELASRDDLLDEDKCKKAIAMITDALLAAKDDATRTGCKELILRLTSASPHVLSVTLPLLLKEFEDKASAASSPSDAACEQLSEAIAGICAVSTPALNAQVLPVLLRMAQPSAPTATPRIVLALGCLKMMLTGPSKGSDERAAILAATLTESVVVPFCTALKSSPPPKGTVQAVVGLSDEILRVLPDAAEHVKFATGILDLVATPEWLSAAGSSTSAHERKSAGSAVGALDAIVIGVLVHSWPSALKGRCAALLDAMLPLALLEAKEAAADAGADLYGKAVGSLANKLDEAEVPRLVQDIIEAKVMPVAKDPASSAAGCRVLGWFTKALLIRGHKEGSEQLEKLFTLLSDQNSTIASGAVKGYEILSGAGALTKAEHCAEKPLWRQKLFVKELARMTKHYREVPSERKGNFLAALALVMAHTPSEALSLQLQSIVPLLVQAVSADTVSVKLAALELLESFVRPVVEDAPSAANEVIPALLEGQVSTLVPSLVSCALLKDKGTLQVRCLALSTLALLPPVLDYHKLYPFRRQVTTDLEAALSDRKRCIRVRAAACRNVWFILSSS